MHEFDYHAMYEHFFMHRICVSQTRLPRGHHRAVMV